MYDDAFNLNSNIVSTSS